MRVGLYEGYSHDRYDVRVRTSQYVAVRDGARLAVDVYRPTICGAMEPEPTGRLDGQALPARRHRGRRTAVHTHKRP